jgi:2-oxoglutarate/2-oxoacid ferredoxin oxidoreductase subunit beta
MTALSIDDYANDQTPAWCPGCGNFSILTALKRALVACGLAPRQVLLVSGIGQGAKMPHYLKCNALNGLHGRTLPTATAAKLVNPELKVIAIGGDGDGYGEGGNHFLHTLRRNPNIAYFVHDNQVYGLTKGQASPTSEEGFVTATTPRGAIEPFHPLALAITAGGTFVARGFAGDIEHLAGLMEAALHHKGLAYIDILQPCVTFNKVNTYAWYRQRVYDIAQETKHDTSNRAAAWQLAQEWGERIPIGILYQGNRHTLEDSLPALAGEPLVRRPIDPKAAAPLLAEFA